MPAPADEPDAVACENCQTISKTVAHRRTPTGRQALCVSCYSNHLTGTRLSPRESEVYAYADSGFTNNEIATELGVDASTVASHLASVRQKYQQAVELAETVEPASTTSLDREREFTEDLPRDLTPGSVVHLQDSAASTDPREPAFTHGIVRRVLTRSQTGVPTRIAVYPFAPEEGAIRMHSPTGMPSVMDNHAEFVDVVFPTNRLLKDLPRTK